MWQKQLRRDDPRYYNVLGLLCACRRIYSETTNITYEKSPFHIDRHVLNTLLRVIIPKRLASIRTLRLYVAVNRPRRNLEGRKRACPKLEKMSGLHTLHVSFGLSHTMMNYDGRDGTPFVEPLLAFRVPEFVVDIPGDMLLEGVECADGSSLDLPFRIVRRER
ncbi:hypothetical protein BDW71DRAFT_24539 [Aspergillus fruticulosus]